jgi:hypothetical protein
VAVHHGGAGEFWQGVAFAGQRQSQHLLIFEYLKFILELYGAQPLAGTQHLHGKKGRALVHVGAVDAPVTIDEINACLAECRAMGQKELHVLGWEWEMGLANMMVDVAKAQGVRLLLRASPYHQVPSRVALPAVIVHSARADYNYGTEMLAGKYVARLRSANEGPRPVLWIRTDGGHVPLFDGEPSLAGQTFAFLLWQTGDPRYQPK